MGNYIAVFYGNNSNPIGIFPTHSGADRYIIMHAKAYNRDVNDYSTQTVYIPTISYTGIKTPY